MHSQFPWFFFLIFYIETRDHSEWWLSVFNCSHWNGWFVSVIVTMFPMTHHILSFAFHEHFHSYKKKEEKSTKKKLQQQRYVYDSMKCCIALSAIQTQIFHRWLSYKLNESNVKRKAQISYDTKHITQYKISFWVRERALEHNIPWKM